MSTGATENNASGERGVLAHVGITVPDLDNAVTWYEAALGLRPLPARVHATADSSERQRAVLSELYGDRCAEMRVAFLVDDKSTAIELFEFDHARDWVAPQSWAYDRAGISHVGILVQDLPAVVDRICSNGGRQRTRIMTAGGDGAWKFCFCEDPYGTVLELQTHSQEQMYGHVDRVSSGRRSGHGDP